MSKFSSNQLLSTLLNNCTRLRTDAIPHDEVTGYKCIDNSVYCGIVNATRSFSEALVAERFITCPGALDHIYAEAKVNGSYDNLLVTLAYLATWGTTTSVMIGTNPREKEYFDFQLSDNLGKVILVGGVKYRPEEDGSTRFLPGRWQVHT